MIEEIELKLAFAPDDLRRLPRKALLRNLKTGMARKRQLSSTYFDTPSLTLQRHGMALRVRDNGEGQVQTLKTPLGGVTPRSGRVAANENGLQHKREFEAALEGDVPNLDLIEDEELQAFFASEAVAGELTPIFTTEFARQAIPLTLADSHIELALDQGHICSGALSLPLCEAELELLSGPPARLYELAMLLHRETPFRLEQESKAARGYHLYADTKAHPQKARKPSLSREMSVADAFEHLARGCVAQMRANEEPALDGQDPEGLHQMRVAVRRLRALLKVFRPAFAAEPHTYLKEDLRWLQKELGAARDWDVFQIKTLPPLRRSLPDADDLQGLSEASEAFRREAYQRARAAILSQRYTGLLLHLSLWLSEGGWQAGGEAREVGEGPVVPFAQSVLNRRLKKFRKLGRRYETLSEPDLHRLRIRGKEVRYAAEFFASLFSAKAAKPYLKRLEAIQDCLGDFNDAATGRGLVAALESRIAADGEGRTAGTAHAAGIVLGWQAAQMVRGLDSFDSAWAALENAKVFWRKG